MTSTRRHLRRLEGRRVCLALAGGNRIDDCDLISAGRGGSQSFWIFSNGSDQFIAHGDVVDCWEA